MSIDRNQCWIAVDAGVGVDGKGGMDVHMESAWKNNVERISNWQAMMQPNSSDAYRAAPLRYYRTCIPL